MPTEVQESYEGLLVEYEVAVPLFARPTDAMRFGAALKDRLHTQLPEARIEIAYDSEMSRSEWKKILGPSLYPEGPGRSLGGAAERGRDYWFDLPTIDHTVGDLAKQIGQAFKWESRTALDSLERSYGGYSSFRTLRHSEEDEDETDQSDQSDLAELLEQAWDRR